MPKSAKNVKKRWTIGLLIDWLNTAYHIEILSGVSDYAEKNGLNLICIVAGRLDAPVEWEKNRNILFDIISRKRMDGLIVLAPPLANFSGRGKLEKLLERYRDFPMVCIGEKFFDKPAVLTDNVKGMKDVLTHLLEHHGYKKIAFITGPAGSSDSEIRFNTYRDMLISHGITFDKNLIVNGNFAFNSGKEAVKILLDERKTVFDAIVSANDYMALGIMDEMQIRGRFGADSIPITGFDDIPESRKANLTSVRQPIYKLGQFSAELLDRCLNGEDVPKDTLFSNELIIRESCGCFSEGISSAIPGNKTVNGDLFTSDLSVISQNIVSKIIETGLSGNEWISESVGLLLDSLSKVLKGDKAADFLVIWSSLIRETSEKRIGFYSLHTLLSLFRRYVISLIPDRKALIQAEDLFQEARIMIGDIIQRGELISKIIGDSEREEISEFGAKLVNTFTFEDQYNVLLTNLPGLGIRSCYISLYRDPLDPIKESNLIFAFNEKGRIALPAEGKTFHTPDIIPDDIFPSDKRFTLITENLYHGQSQLGIIVFEYGPKNEQMYEILRTKINDSLIGTLLFQRIQNQAKDLEQQVIQRTSELYRANARLHLEVLEKQKAEEKLKKSEERFREMALLLPTVIVETDMNLNIIFLNKAGLEIFEMTEESLKSSLSFLDFLMEEDRPKAEEYASHVIAGQVMNFMVFRIIKRDNTRISFLTKADPVYINNVIEGIRWNAIDIKQMISSVFKLEESFFHDYYFTPREKEILELVIEGCRNREIAERLFIQTGSVKDHITNIYAKIGVKNRDEFFERMRDYQVSRFGYQSFVFTLLSKIMKE